MRQIAGWILQLGGQFKLSSGGAGGKSYRPGVAAAGKAARVHDEPN